MVNVMRPVLRKLISICWLVVGLLFNSTSFAHQTGNSYLTLSEVDGRLQLEIDFIVRDLGNLLQVEGQAKLPPPTPEQLLSLQPAITEAIQKSLAITVDAQTQALTFMHQSVVLHNDGLYVRQRFQGQAIAPDAKFVVVRYAFFTENDQLGRAFFKLVLRKDELSSVFDQTNSIQRFALGESKRWTTMGLFTKEGFRHIWGGADHLLFLLTLLLPGLMLAGRTDLSAETRSFKNREAEKFALKVITAFTVAHSITLAMSVFGWVNLPDKWIESVIALSIIVSALLNLQNRFHFSHWKLAFLFGLIHGMGFANGLRELGLSSTYFLETLLAFNLGVELGQLSAVLLVGVPVVLLAKETQTKQRIMTYGSIGVLLISAVWLVQRVMT